MAPQSRIDILEASLREQPDDTFTRYLLAMEYRSAGRIDDAIALLQTIIQADTNYVPAHFQLAQCFEQIERFDEARAAYELGIQIARQTGDRHAANEMQQALDMLDE